MMLIRRRRVRGIVPGRRHGLPPIPDFLPTARAEVFFNLKSQMRFQMRDLRFKIAVQSHAAVSSLPRTMPPTAEQRRLDEDKRGAQPWRRWGPYLSERQWGTVREDYSPDGS